MNTGPEQTFPSGAAPRRGRWWLVAGGVLAVLIGGVVAAVALGGAGRTAPGPVASSAAPEPSPTPTPTASGSAVPLPSPSPSAESDEPVAVFLGDSYTEGWGATEPSTRWSAIVAAESDWVEVNQGQGGTGFVTTAGLGGCGLDFCPTYLDRVPDVIAANPDIVVIAGGQNDLVSLSNDPDAVRAAVNETYDLIRAALPDARIIAVGPSIAQPNHALINELDTWVQAIAERVDADYVSLIDPVVIRTDMVEVDGVHVNDKGHRAIAERVLDGIR
jgi:lysophospholipase L1-like esterase